MLLYSITSPFFQETPCSNRLTYVCKSTMRPRNATQELNQTINYDVCGEPGWCSNSDSNDTKLWCYKSDVLEVELCTTIMPDLSLDRIDMMNMLSRVDR